MTFLRVVIPYILNYVRAELSRGCARGLQGARKNNKPHVTNLTPRGVASHWLSFRFDSTRLDSASFDWPRLVSPCLPHHTLSRFVSCRLVSSRVASFVPSAAVRRTAPRWSAHVGTRSAMLVPKPIRSEATRHDSDFNFDSDSRSTRSNQSFTFSRVLYYPYDAVNYHKDSQI